MTIHVDFHCNSISHLADVLIFRFYQRRRSDCLPVLVGLVVMDCLLL